ASTNCALSARSIDINGYSCNDANPVATAYNWSDVASAETLLNDFNFVFDCPVISSTSCSKTRRNCERCKILFTIFSHLAFTLTIASKNEKVGEINVLLNSFIKKLPN